MSDALVFHRGSLGDSILVWPILRALKASGRRVTFVTDASKAALAAAELGVIGVSAEQPRWSAMWMGGARESSSAAVHRCAAKPASGGPLILSFLADPASPAGRAWLANAARMFPGAEIIPESRRVDRVVALECAARFGGAPPVTARRNPGGPVVIHVGAGSEEKRLPMGWWVALMRDATVRERVMLPCPRMHEALATRPRGDRGSARTPPHGRVSYVAGEVERERFSSRERELFKAVGGAYIDDLPTLAATLKAARLYAGADTGPTHLAAALGVRTVAFFGPTDPARWAPIGPRVRVVGLRTAD